MFCIIFVTNLIPFTCLKSPPQSRNSSLIFITLSSAILSLFKLCTKLLIKNCTTCQSLFNSRTFITANIILPNNRRLRSNRISRYWKRAEFTCEKKMCIKISSSSYVCKHATRWDSLFREWKKTQTKEKKSLKGPRAHSENCRQIFLDASLKCLWRVLSSRL